MRRSHSAQLVEITDTLGDPPFGLLYRLSAFAFSIFAVQHTGTKGENKTFWRLANRRFSNLHFLVLSAAFVPFY
ncbi:hypothetical protein H5410_051132 [Solanum commersonii]|uniref:Uncharacterized protein n=1 Tax=Solanum commersonii TaxID=4109 RepID=A0A9J5WXC8_SOLCO|nr:hypothetical protein H5410_051132 [Solanum commersonii]